MLILKLLYIVLGSISLFLGVLGVFLPGLPTTPFLLLSAALYCRSSEKLYNKLLANKYLGAYIHTFRKNKGMTLRTKLFSLCIMWFMIALSSIFLIDSSAIIIAVLAVGITGTVVMGFIIRTVKEKQCEIPCRDAQKNPPVK